MGNVIAQYGLQLAKYLMPMITLPYLARVLGPDGYGVRTYVLSVMTLAQSVADYGFSLSATKEITAARENKNEIGKIISSVYASKLILCAAILLVLSAGTMFVPILRENYLYTFFAFISVVFTTYLPDYLFMAFEKMGIITTRYVVSKSVGVVLTLLLVKSEHDLLLVPICDIVVSCIALVWSWKSVRDDYGIQLSITSPVSVFSSLKASTIYFATNFSSTLFNSFSTLMLGMFITQNALLAYWGVAMSALGAVQSLYTPISTSLYPHMLSNQNFGLFHRLIRLSIIPALFGTILFYLLADFIMLVLGGESYVQGSYVIKTLSPILFFSFYSIMFGWPSLGACGAEKQLALTAFLSGAFNVIAVLATCITGFASLVSISLIRVLAELILCLLRVRYARKMGLLTGSSTTLSK